MSRPSTLIAALALALVTACAADRAAPSVAPTRKPPSTPPPEAKPGGPTHAQRPHGAPPTTPPESCRRTDSGLAIEWLRPAAANGKPPGPHDRIEVRYQVWNHAGESVARSAPDRTEHLAMGWLFPGWAEAMTQATPGSHLRIWVPEALAYPEQANAPRGPLVVEVELVSIDRVATPTARDVPITAPPSNALHTASGIAFVILREGTGKEHPSADARVTVHYEGWTTDGNQFDSSYERGRPTTFPLRGVIKGWQQAVPLMVVGEKTRFWIPAELAYGDSPGRPQGTLVFDIELLEFE